MFAAQPRGPFMARFEKSFLPFEPFHAPQYIVVLGHCNFQFWCLAAKHHFSLAAWRIMGLPRAFSVPIESERRLQFFVLTRFLDANRHPLRWKTL